MLRSVAFSLSLLALVPNSYAQEDLNLKDLITLSQPDIDCKESDPKVSQFTHPQKKPKVFFKRAQSLQKEAQHDLQKHCEAIYHYVEAIKALKDLFKKDLNSQEQKSVSKNTENSFNFFQKDQKQAVKPTSIFPDTMASVQILMDKELSKIYKKSLLNAAESAEKIGAFADANRLITQYYKFFYQSEPQKANTHLLRAVENSLQGYRDAKRDPSGLREAREYLQTLEVNTLDKDFFQKEVYPFVLFVSTELANRDLLIGRNYCQSAYSKASSTPFAFNKKDRENKAKKAQKESLSAYKACRLRLEEVITKYPFTKATPQALFQYAELNHQSIFIIENLIKEVNFIIKEKNISISEKAKMIKLVESITSEVLIGMQLNYEQQKSDLIKKMRFQTTKEKSESNYELMKIEKKLTKLRGFDNNLKNSENLDKKDPIKEILQYKINQNNLAISTVSKIFDNSLFKEKIEDRKELIQCYQKKTQQILKKTKLDHEVKSINCQSALQKYEKSLIEQIKEELDFYL